jgi:hypothetical protein
VIDPGSAPSGPPWRDIGALAARVGHYRWLELRLFEVTGAAAAGPGDLEPRIRVWLAASARRHGALAERWAEHLPVRAGVDPATLVVRPPEAERIVDPLESATGGAELVSALVGSALPVLAGLYGGDLAAGNPVSEAPVMELLAEAGSAARSEIASGEALQWRLTARSLEP